MTTTQSGGSLHFTVSGLAITELARTLAREPGRDQDALRLLADIHGLAVHEAYQILQGTKALVGAYPATDAEGELRLEDDTDTAYATAIQARFARFTQLPGRIGYWEPYALVAYGFGLEDARWARQRENRPVQVLRRAGYTGGQWMDYRALYYADDRDRDVVYYGDSAELGMGANTALFRAVGFLPAWVPREWVAGTPEQAVQRAGASLDFRGAHPPDRFQPGFLQLPDDTRPPKSTPREDPVEAEEPSEASVDPSWLEQITRQADQGMGWVNLIVDRPSGDERPSTYRIPKAPWFRWCAKRAFDPEPDAADPRFPWDNVCPRGLKLLEDNRDHSDWLVGAGLSPWAMYAGPDYDKPLTEAAWRARYEDVPAAGHTELRVVVLHPPAQACHAVAVHPEPDTECPPGCAVVVPSADTAYYVPGHSGSRVGGFVVAETGGALSHLATVSREDGIPLFILPRARDLIPAGAVVSWDPANPNVITVSPP